MSFEAKDPPVVPRREETVDYEPPAVVVLGTVAELTQEGTAPTDELLNDGALS
jgi:hypothetical protein